MQDANYAAWFAKWSQDMASDAGSGRVPPPTEATLSSAGGPGGGKAGFKRAGRDKARSRVPPVSKAFTRKL